MNSYAKISVIFLLLVFCLLPAHAQTVDWSKVESAIGRKGSVKDNMLKVTFPRLDLKVRVCDVEVSPGLALTSWMGFMQQDGMEEMVMGDIVLLDKELPAVEAKLIEEGISITAIHNHLINESPSVVYMHIEGSGNGEVLAGKLKAAFALTGTPPPPQPAAPSQIDWSDVENIIGRKGNHNGNLLQYGIAREEKIMENGMEIPPYMGMAIAINIQKAGDKVATTGDFVLVANEIAPVMKALHEHGILATALHNHMSNETPRMFMMHFWGYDTPINIAKGLAAALKETHVK